MTVIVGIIVCLILSAFFSGSEIAFISANKLGIALKGKDGSRKGKIITKFYENPKQFLSTMLVGNNIALVAFTFFMTKLLEPTFTPVLGDGVGSLLFYTLLITVVVLVFGEYIPKTLFSLYSDRLMFVFAYPLSFFKWLLTFPTVIMTGLSNFLFKYVARVPSDQIDRAFTRLDLEHFIDENLEDEDSDIDKEMLTNALQLNNQKVRDCMVPRTEIKAIDISEDINGAIKAFQDSKLSRIIVIENDIENIVGYIHHQQLFSKPKTIKSFMLPIPFVPEAMNLKSLMLKFIENNVNIVCVVDEYGSVSGIITLEDILEEIFGEIEDEHDDAEFTEIKYWDDEYLFSGRLEIDYLNEKYEHIDLPSGDYQTLSGYIVMTSGSIPEEGAEIELDGYKFILESVSDTKIETVKLIKLPSEITEADSENK